jgi:hypothetical protein
MLTSARVEPAQLQTVNDLIQALFSRYTQEHYFKRSFIVTIHIIAILVQMFVINDPTAEDFHTSN